MVAAHGGDDVRARPDRGRVIAAKLLAGCALALAAVAVCLLVAVVGNVLADGRWDLAPSVAGGAASW